MVYRIDKTMIDVLPQALNALGIVLKTSKKLCSRNSYAEYELACVDFTLESLDGHAIHVDASKDGLLFSCFNLYELCILVLGGKASATSFVIDGAHRVQNYFHDCETRDEVNIKLDLIEAQLDTSKHS